MMQLPVKSAVQLCSEATEAGKNKSRVLRDTNGRLAAVGEAVQRRKCSHDRNVTIDIPAERERRERNSGVERVDR